MYQLTPKYENNRITPPSPPSPRPLLFFLAELSRVGTVRQVTTIYLYLNSAEMDFLW